MDAFSNRSAVLDWDIHGPVISNRRWRSIRDPLDMAAFGRDCVVTDSAPFRPWRKKHVTTVRFFEVVGIANTLVHARLDFTGDCARLSAPRTRRAALLGTHDAARNPHAGVGSSAGTRPTSCSFSLGTISTMAGARDESWPCKTLQGIWTSISAPVSAWLLSALALWIWHVPRLFDRTLSNDWIHAAQHTTFLVTALIFWWPVVNRTPAFGYGGSLIYVFTTILHTSVLGALLTFAPRPWYSSYVITAPTWHLSALEDQQLGGLIMWIPAGTLLLIVALVLLVKWMNQSQTRWQYTRLAELANPLEGGGE
jgi:hypothetical protein